MMASWKDRIEARLFPKSVEEKAQLIEALEDSRRYRSQVEATAEKAQQENQNLRGLLEKALNVVEVLEMRTAESSDREDAALANKLEIIREIDSAIALANGAPWQSPGLRQQWSESGPAAGLIEAREAILKMKPSEATQLKETIYGMAELEIALEDRGWKRLIAQSNYEFSRFGIQSIMLVCRLYYIKNPLARRGVDVSAFYVFGRGLEISSPDADANETLQDFFLDPANADQFSHTALVKKERQTYTDGNIFFAFFTDPQTGKTTARSLDPLEISQVQCDPNDSTVAWFYKREWMESGFTVEDGPREPKNRVQWYVALGWDQMRGFPDISSRMIKADPIATDARGEPIPVLHLKDGELPGWHFGCSRMYPALDWLRAYRQVLEDLCTTWRALARFAWNVETKGGAPAIAAFKQALATTLANDLSQIETNPPPVTGSAWISSPNNKITPMQTGSATMNPDNARRVLLMVCAAFGIGEHLMGDATTGSLATAASLERPTELMFLERQEVWREVLQRIGHYVLSRSLQAPKGKLREAIARRQKCKTANVDTSKVVFINATRRKESGLESVLSEAKGNSAAGGESDPAEKTQTGRDKISIEVKFPDILAHDIKERVAAIVQAMTLGGFEPTGIDEKTGVALLLSELGVEDPTVVLEAMFPDDEYDANRTNKPEPPSKITSTVADVADDAPATAELPPAPPKQDLGAEPSKGKAKESRVSQDPVVIERAVIQLLAAARKNLQGLKRKAS